MSETIIEEKQESPEPETVTDRDLQQMLDEARNKAKSLEREMGEERAARLLAEKERDTAASRVVSEAEQRWAAQKQAVEGSIAAVEAKAERAEREYAAAAESGDWAAAARAQRAIAAAEAEASKYRGQKEFLESNKERLIGQVQQSQASSDDKYAAVVRDLKPAEREWLEQRPQFLSDSKYQSRVFNASGLAVAEGNARGTPEYFRRIEELLGETKRADEVRQTEPDPEPQRPMSADIAPQRRATPGASPAGSRGIKLTADQVEVADGLYGNPASPDYIADPTERYKKYWSNMERMKASGRL